MQLTGHKTRSVFERYNIVSPGDLRDAARRLDEAAGHTFGHTGPKKAVSATSESANKLLKRMERETGIEPATSSLGSLRSTAELLPLSGSRGLRPACHVAQRRSEF